MTARDLCVVTGTSGGIGLAVCETLIDEGWHVLGLARRDSPLKHARYSHTRLDLADLGAVEHYFTQEFPTAFPADSFTRFGLVNNAALLEPLAPMPALSLQSLANAFSVNAIVPIWLMGYFERYARGRPLRIVNVSTGAATSPRAGMTAYCTTKAALLMSGRVFQDEGEHYPDVGDSALLSLEPGVVNTDMQTTIRGKTRDEFPAVERFMVLHRDGKLLDAQRPATEIAVFLRSDGQPRFSEGRVAG